MKLCNRCDTYFKPRVSYQIYCSDICREESTKEKIAERYIATRRQKCLGGCNLDLSIYNESGFCSNCNVNEKQVAKMIKQLKGFITYEQE